MPGYFDAVGAQANSHSPGLSATVTPGASRGVALVGVFVVQEDSGGGVVGQQQVCRATGGTGGTATTPEKGNSRSSAFASTFQKAWATTEPTLSGNPIAILSYCLDAAGALTLPRRWLVPNPRYPIYEEPSGSKIGLREDILTISTRTLSWWEPTTEAIALSGRYRGRRATEAAGFFIQDSTGFFPGVSTNPKNGVGSTSYRFINSLDWPQPVNSSLSTFLNLLNGGPVFDPSTLPWIPTLPERFSVARWNPERSETARAAWTQSLWAIPPTKPPEPTLPDFFVRQNWNPERGQTIWNPFQFASIVIPTWGYDVLGPQAVLRTIWNPERSSLSRAGWTQALWAVAPQKIPEPTLPESFLRLAWNPEKTDLPRAGWVQALWAIPPKGWEPLLPGRPYPIVSPDRTMMAFPVQVATTPPPPTTLYAIFVFDD